MKVLTVEAAVRAAMKRGADDRAVERLRRWKKRGMTDDDRKVYEIYRRNWNCGRGFIELALSHGVNPGTLRNRCHRRGMTINKALRFDSSHAHDSELVEVRRREDGLWRGKVV